MARIDNLENFLIDISAAIKPKAKISEPIAAQQFDAIIDSLVILEGQEKIITPSKTEQIIEPDEGYTGITKATIRAVDANVDPNIIPENIKKGKTILGVDGVVEERGKYQDMEVEFTSNIETFVRPDEGFDAIERLKVTVNVEGGGGQDTSDATATSLDLIYPKTAYARGQKITGQIQVTEKSIDSNSLITSTDKLQSVQHSAFNDDHLLIQRNGKTLTLYYVDDEGNVETLLTNDTIITSSYYLTTSLQLSNGMQNPNKDGVVEYLLEYSTRTASGTTTDYNSGYGIDSNGDGCVVRFARIINDNGEWTMQAISTTYAPSNRSNLGFAMHNIGNNRLGWLATGANGGSTATDTLYIGHLTYTFSDTISITSVTSYTLGQGASGGGYASRHGIYQYKFKQRPDRLWDYALVEVHNNNYFNHTDTCGIQLVRGIMAADFSAPISYTMDSNASYSGIYATRTLVTGGYFIDATLSGRTITLKLYNSEGTTGTRNLLHTSTINVSSDILSIVNWIYLESSNNMFAVFAGSNNARLYTFYVFFVIDNKIVFNKTSGVASAAWYVPGQYNMNFIGANEDTKIFALASDSLYAILENENTKLRTSMTDLNYTYYNTYDSEPGSASKIVEGVEVYDATGKITGTMKDNGQIIVSPSTEDVEIPEGYTSGGIIQGDDKLIPENIKSGVTIFGVEGDFGLNTDDANATENDIIYGKTAYVKDRKVTGNIMEAPSQVSHNDDTLDIIDNTANNTIEIKMVEDGNKVYKDGTITSANISYGKLANEINLTADKIIFGATILGIHGTAVAGDSPLGKLVLEDGTIIANKIYANETAMLEDEDVYVGLYGFLFDIENDEFVLRSYKYTNYGWIDVHEDVDYTGTITPTEYITACNTAVSIRNKDIYSKEPIIKTGEEFELVVKDQAGQYDIYFNFTAIGENGNEGLLYSGADDYVEDYAPYYGYIVDVDTDTGERTITKAGTATQDILSLVANINSTSSRIMSEYSCEVSLNGKALDYVPEGRYNLSTSSSPLTAVYLDITHADTYTTMSVTASMMLSMSRISLPFVPLDENIQPLASMVSRSRYALKEDDLNIGTPYFKTLTPTEYMEAEDTANSILKDPVLPDEPTDDIGIDGDTEED